MPRKPPAEPIDHHYNIPRLNRAFFWAGALLTVVFVWMVLADYKRDWKSIQQTFLRLDRDKTLEAAQAAHEKLSLIHISEPTRLGMISYAVFCLKKKKK